MIFANRSEAGRILARLLLKYANRPDVLVLALPGGGVPVASEVAQALRAPLDIFFVRKLGLPYCEELAMGAIACGGIQALNHEVVLRLGLSVEEIDLIAAQEQKELKQRELLFRNGRPGPTVFAKTIIIVDDGLVTGCSMKAAIKALRSQQPARIIVAVPVGPRCTCSVLAGIADELVSVVMPETLHGVSCCYDDFAPIGDDEVRRLLARPAQTAPQQAA